MIKNLYVFQTGLLGVNTWLVPENNTNISSNKNSWYIVDPGGNSFDIITWFLEKKSKPLGIFLTHGHFDHVGAVPELMKQWKDIPLFIHKGDKIAVGKNSRDFHVKTAENMCLYKYKEILKEDLPEATTYWDDGFKIGEWKVLHTPGHTPGSVCLYNEKEETLLSGDTLFCQGEGRTDMEGGSYSAMQNSLVRLSKLPTETIVLPGHGETTTIMEEF